MNKYLLPIIYNNRRLGILALSKQNITKNTFIIDCNTNKLVLLTIKKDKYLQSLSIGEKDFLLKELNFDFEFIEKNIFKLKISNEIATKHISPENVHQSFRDIDHVEVKKITQKITDTNKLFTLNTIANANLLVDDTDSIFELSLLVNDELKAAYIIDNTIEIKIEWNYKEQVLNNELTFAIATPLSFLNIGFDFGSEASQIRQKKYRKNGLIYEERTTDIALLDAIKNHYKKTEKDEEFFQHEKNTPFLKSIFYAKKNLYVNSNFEDESFLTNQDEIKLLTHKQEVDYSFLEQWQQLPNLKLAHKYSSNLYDFKFTLNINERTKNITLDELKEKLYASILLEILTAYFENNIWSDKKIDFKITLLIPNIYDTNDIQRTKYVVSEIINKINIKILNQQIRNFEIITLSESDASFMGYYNTGENFVEKNKYYLIVDCGKGTTDFSIVKSGNLNINEYENLFRNGFAGAGNFITYSFFEAFFYHIVSIANNPDNAKKYLLNLLNNSDVTNKNSLFSIIEKYKINYQINRTNIEIEDEVLNARSETITFKNIFDDTSTFNITTLFNLMSQISTCYNWNNYISNAVANIVSGITSNVDKITKNLFNKNVACGGILVTGRGFLFEPLKKTLQLSLADINISDSLLMLPKNNVDFKTICLQGVFRTSYLYNPDIMCLPTELPGDVAFEEILPKQGGNNVIKRFWNKLANNINDTLFDELKNFNEIENNLKITQKDFNKLRLIIGNYYYELTNANMQKGDVQYLIYSGTEYLICSYHQNKLLDYSSIKPLSELNDIQINNISPSLFPAILDTDSIDFLKINFVKPKTDKYDKFMPQ